MQRRLFLNVVVTQRASIFKLFPRENEPLLVWGNTLLVLNFLLDILNGIAEGSTSSVMVLPVSVLMKICILSECWNVPLSEC